MKELVYQLPMLSRLGLLAPTQALLRYPHFQPETATASNEYHDEQDEDDDDEMERLVRAMKQSTLSTTVLPATTSSIDTDYKPLPDASHF